QLGIPTTIVEAGELGGVCLNVGCIPSKALITASKSYAKTQKMATMGITVSGASVDMGKMQTWKGGIVKRLTTGVGQLLKANGVKIVKGRASIEKAGWVSVTADDGSQSKLECSAIIVATGSRPIQVPGFEFDNQNILDSTGALALDELPKHMVVIGGGYIGLELGGTYSRMGTKVTVVEMMDQLLPGFDKDLVQPVERALKKDKTKIMLKTKALGWKKSGDELLCEVEDSKGRKQEIPCDKILVTVGRRPNSENLGLDSAGVQTDSRGFIQINTRLETNVPGIYAIGDVAGGLMLAHKASKEGEVVAEVVAGKATEIDVKCIPAIVFTDPEVASVGLTAKEARAAGHEVTIGKYPFAALGRSMTTNQTDGFARVVVAKDTKEILGAQIVGAGASDLISEAGLAIEMGAFADDISLTVHAHPTLPEALMEAAAAAIGESIHLINK
ncbi:MAG TPA: dihydrolipoyl dehydrogenase, partial [Myxococcales bacterium]|nr:dihydrolipoyl dehydrogenase [Myxococcales bacterium]